MNRKQFAKECHEGIAVSAIRALASAIDGNGWEYVEAMTDGEILDAIREWTPSLDGTFHYSQGVGSFSQSLGLDPDL